MFKKPVALPKNVKNCFLRLQPRMIYYQLSSRPYLHYFSMVKSGVCKEAVKVINY